MKFLFLQNNIDNKMHLSKQKSAIYRMFILKTDSGMDVV